MSEDGQEKGSSGRRKPSSAITPHLGLAVPPLCRLLTHTGPPTIKSHGDREAALQPGSTCSSAPSPTWQLTSLPLKRNEVTISKLLRWEIGKSSLNVAMCNA